MSRLHANIAVKAPHKRGSSRFGRTLMLVIGLAINNFATADLALDSNKLTSAQDDAAREEWAYSLGIQAYVFGLPLVVYEREYALRTNAAMIEKVKHLFRSGSRSSGSFVRARPGGSGLLQHL